MAPKPDGRGTATSSASAGHDFFAVASRSASVVALRSPPNLDPFVALCLMCKALRRDRLPDGRIVIRFDLSGRPRRDAIGYRRARDTEIARRTPAREDLYITAEAEAFVEWHAGQLYLS